MIIVGYFGETKDGLLQFLGSTRLEFPLAHYPERVFGLRYSYGMAGSPSCVVIGPDCVVIDSWVRNVGRLEAALAAAGGV
ncbi:MAG: hypothetical protein ACLQVD_08420 [Capsulimonadaceae bacterium]